MKTFEKPYEHLGVKEKEVISLCAEVVRWSIEKARDPLTMEKAKLRKQAGELYEILGGADLVDTDSYYKVFAPYERLKDDFEKLKRSSEQYKESLIDFVHEDTDDVIKQIYDSLGRKGSFSGKQWTEYVESWYGDYVCLQVYKTNGTYKILVDELWDYSENASDSHIRQMKPEFEARFSFKIDFSYRLHDFASAYQVYFSVDGIPPEKLSEALKFIIERIKSNPRIKKNKNEEAS